MILKKIPSFFNTPKNRRFNLEPRYYDPVKEELSERESRIRHEMGLNNQEEQYKGPSIRGSFKKASAHKPASVVIIRLLVVVALTGTIVAYLNFGAKGLSFLMLPIIIYMALRRTKIL